MNSGLRIPELRPLSYSALRSPPPRPHLTATRPTPKVGLPACPCPVAGGWAGSPFCAPEKQGTDQLGEGLGGKGLWGTHSSSQMAHRLQQNKGFAKTGQKFHQQFTSFNFQ